MAAADACGLVVSRADAHPGREVSLGGKRRCGSAHLGNNLLRRVHPQTGYLRQALHLVLVGTKQIGQFLVELGNLVGTWQN